MLSESQCLTRAAEFMDLAAQSQTEVDRTSYLALATGWKRAAAMAAFNDERRSHDPIKSGHSTGLCPDRRKQEANIAALRESHDAAYRDELSRRQSE